MGLNRSWTIPACSITNQSLNNEMLLSVALVRKYCYQVSFTQKMTKLFVTGVTGFIGGDAIYAIYKAHPEYEITCLVRSSDKAATVANEYPKFQFIYGDLNSVELIVEESKKADIVISKAISFSRLSPAYCAPLMA